MVTKPAPGHGVPEVYDVGVIAAGGVGAEEEEDAGIGGTGRCGVRAVEVGFAGAVGQGEAGWLAHGFGGEPGLGLDGEIENLGDEKGRMDAGAALGCDDGHVCQQEKQRQQPQRGAADQQPEIHGAEPEQRDAGQAGIAALATSRSSSTLASMSMGSPWGWGTL